MNIENIYPLIIPRSYVDDIRWKLPFERFSIPEFVLTWVEFEGENPLVYLTETQFDALNKDYHNWQQQSFENLSNSSEYFHTQAKYSDYDNKNIVFISFLNSDGIGSSRVLLNFELSRAFPKGYYLAFPDRSCGLIISKNITDKELEETKQLVRTMFKGAVTPMTDEIFEPEFFTLPDSWTTPVDKEFSNQIINAITE